MLRTYIPEVDEFLEIAFQEMKRAKVKIVITTFKYVKLSDSVKCNGYFCGEYDDGYQAEFAISVGKPLSKWLPVFIHEYCHFKQWMENSKCWRAFDKFENNEENLLFDWVLDREMVADVKMLKKVLKVTREVELDCERRVIKMIEKYNLPLNKTLYSKRAGAYIMFYNYMFKHRTWYKIGREPYNNKELMKLMPKNLNGNYSRLNAKVEKILHQCV